MIAPLQSWIVCQTVTLMQKLTAWPPLEMLRVSAGKSRTMPVRAQNRKATQTTMSSRELMSAFLTAVRFSSRGGWPERPLDSSGAVAVDAGGPS